MRERFASHCEDPKIRLLPEDIVLESFKNLELQLAATLSEQYKREKSPELMAYTRRAVAYYNEISNFTGNKEIVTLSFQWHSDDPKSYEIEIDYLYKLLTGSNSAKISLLHPNVTRDHFLHLFSGQTWPTKMIWDFDLNTLPYLIDELTEAFRIPVDVEQGKRKTKKKPRGYLNERTVACFVDQNGASLTATQLTSLLSKFKRESKQGIFMNEIIYAFRLFQK